MLSDPFWYYRPLRVANKAFDQQNAEMLIWLLDMRDWGYELFDSYLDLKLMHEFLKETKPNALTRELAR